MLPGTCIVCGSADKPVLDFGMSLEFHGVVYFCRDCITEAALAFGDVVSKLDHERTLERAKIAERAVEPILKIVKKVYEQHDAAANYLRTSITAAYAGWDIPDSPKLLETPIPEPERVDSGTDGTIEQDSDVVEFERAVGVSGDPFDGPELFGDLN